MAANTERIQDGALTIKFSPDYPLTPQQRSKLVLSLELAQRVLRKAIAALDAVLTDPEPRPSTIGSIAYKVLRSHFKFAKLELDPTLGGRFGGADWTQWMQDARHVRQVYERLLLALGQPITIADAHASTMRKSEPVCFEALARKYDIFDTLHAVPVAQKMLLAQAAQLMAGAESAQTAGFVSPKRAKVASLTADELARRKAHDPSLTILPDEKGSIHINFASLLHGEQYRKLQVARTIIHEASHKFCDTRDIAYSFHDGYKSMTRPQALLNADSYAYAAVSLYKDHVFADSRAMEQSTMDLDG